jgi:1-acyl-sn-glycerol-3-phosphate acyltransferase
MYPEGTIPAHAPRMKAFKNGAFRMAVDQKVPIVPVTWVQNYKIMLDPGKLFSYSLPSTVEVIVHPPVRPEEQSDDEVVHLRKRVFEIIEGPLPDKYKRTHED